MTPDPDIEIVRRLQAGDESALSELLERYRRPIFEFTYRMLNDAAEAEEAAQDTFIRAWRNARAYRPRARFSTWLFQIARNAALDRCKTRARRPIFQRLELFFEKVPTLGKNPALEFQSLELSDRIARAVSELPEDQRAALVLAEYQGQSLAEIAAVLRCSERAVEGRLRRARMALRKRLGDLLK